MCSSLLFITTAGVAVILTIITMLSTPILTSIFGDGSLEVCKGATNANCIKNQNCSEPGGGYRGLGQL